MATHLEPSEPVTSMGITAADSRPAVGAGAVTHPGTLSGTVLSPTARRLAVGYVRVRPDTSAADSDQVTGRLSAFATRSGLDLVDIYTDRHPFRRSAFGALLHALRRPDITAVVIPAPRHLSEFDGIYRGMRMLIEVETRCEVVVMDDGIAP
ncbi:recombinase family protein [Nonomuraea sp. CA-143628]|uniref:recombinase family protein n=1 Tax=Nonomuraea sp. CA-143628 TaxID=3239997 RepID=UPI003D94DB83